MVLAGGNLATGITNTLVLGANNKIVSADGSKLTFTLTASQGLFSGSVVNPATAKPIAFKGVILQKQSIGSGFFLGTNQSGQVLWSPGAAGN